MKLYLVYHENIPEEATRILISYYEVKRTSLDTFIKKSFPHSIPDLFLDSGAYSAFTQGEKINIRAYCDYIKRYSITNYSNLDVIGNASKTLENQKYMESRGLKPIPVFHVGEDWECLEYYIEKYSYIALGGIVPYLRVDLRHDSKNILMSWLVKCFKMAQGKSVFHGFGCTKWEIIQKFPWYSVDSSSWIMGMRYGEVRLFDSRQGKIVYTNLGQKNCFKYAHIFRSLGFDPKDFADRRRNDDKKVARVVALSFLKAEEWAERQHGLITIPQRNETKR